MEINTNPTPAMLATGLRYLGALLGGWLLQKGYISGADADIVGGVVLGAGTLGYGVWKTHANKQKLTQAAVTQPSQIELK